MGKKQNSIDSFVKQLKRKGLLLTEDSEYIVAYLEAKAMHKEEVIKFTADWIIELKKGDKHLIGKYYNETYGETKN